MMNLWLEKSALRWILTNSLRDEFNEEDFIDKKSKTMLSLFKKYKWDELSILGELDNIDEETKDYGLEIISSLWGRDMN